MWKWTAQAHTGLADVLAKRIALLIKNNKFILLLILTLLACASQNLIPVHIAFIPVIIPPLITLMNKLKLDRRSVACALAFGLVTPYIIKNAGCRMRSGYIPSAPRHMETSYACCILHSNEVPIPAIRRRRRGTHCLRHSCMPFLRID